MQMMLAENLAYTTTRIESYDQSGQRFVGTGSFYNFLCSDDRRVPVIVTNRHLIRGSTHAIIHMTRAADNDTPLTGQFETVDLCVSESAWIPHPNDEVDLCVLPIAELLRQAQAKSRRMFYRAFEKSLLPSDDELSKLAALEDVVMVGYPTGIWDSANNMPVFRKGITATHPYIDYEGRKEFLVDIACFPGSSGSPVLLYNMGTYPNADGGITVGSRLKLLGILPTQSTTVPTSQIPINLGVVIRSERLLDFEQKDLFCVS